MKHDINNDYCYEALLLKGDAEKLKEILYLARTKKLSIFLSCKPFSGFQTNASKSEQSVFLSSSFAAEKKLSLKTDIKHPLKRCANQTNQRIT